ncbi:MAG: tetratricopeptide repeat protein [Acidobacteria bacterium]|nr:tetratricopeptide repeat protein [Acidobacteriota bacterium]
MKVDYLKYLTVLAAGLLLLCTVPVFSQTQPGQNPQARPAQAVAQQEEQEYTEEEYEAYEKACNEKDLDKQGPMLLGFMEKYPNSKLQQYIVTSFQTLMYELQKQKKYDKLEPLAEQWLKYFPDDLQTWVYIADAAQKLGHFKKFTDYGLKIYAQKPTAGMCYYLAEAFEKTGDQAQHLAWTEKLFGYPEFDDKYELRMIFVKKHAEEKRMGKAAEYAQLALKSMVMSKRPDGVAEAEWNKRLKESKRSCHYLIGLNLYDEDKYRQAIQELERALAVDPRFDMAYYYIGLSQWKLGQVENHEAPLSFAKAYLLKGEMSGQAKEHLEKIYKAIHNNTTIGIDKIYRRAESELAGEKAEAR